MSEATELRARAAHYRAVAEGADLTMQCELLKIAGDFEDLAARLDALLEGASGSAVGESRL